MTKDDAEAARGERGEFGKLIRYTLPGYASGLLVGALLDYFGLQRNPLGNWLVRTFSGEGESIFEGFYALRQRLSRARGSMAEAYGWGKLAGMTAPWIIDLVSRLLGLNVYAVEGFYIPYFYALGDQIGANVAGLIFLHREKGGWRRALSAYARNPVMLSSLAVILVVPIALLFARILGFSPTTQVWTALETIAANLCWVPPLVGWMRERKEGQDDDS